jgi:hypothetical protein
MPTPLTISFIPGYTWIVGELVTAAKLNLAANPTIALYGTISTSSIGDGSITEPKYQTGSVSTRALADLSVTTAKLADLAVTSGKLALVLDLSLHTVTLPPGSSNSVAASSGAVATLAGTMVLDDTIPQLTLEGTPITALNCTITPRSATSTLEIMVVLMLSTDVSTNNIVAALFQDSTADALAAAYAKVENNLEGVTLTLLHRMTSGTTSATTFKVNAGGTAGAVTLNGSNTARKLGGVLKSWMTVKEL